MPEHTSTNAKIISGIATRTTNALESNPETATIPGLWSRFFQENIGGRISNSSGSNTMYGVYTEYESDHRGAYTLIIGKESDEAINSEELVSKSVPAGEYLTFEKAGKLPGATIQAWQDVWAYFEGNTEYERLYTADFEEYNSDEGVCIYIAIKSV